MQIVAIPDMSGDFDSAGNLISLTEFLTSQLSRDALLSLQSLVQQGQDNPEVRQNFAQEANKIAPGLGNTLNSYLGGQVNNMTLLQTLMVILTTILAGLTYYNSSSSPPTVINKTYNYYGPGGKPKTEQVAKPQPGKRGSNLTPPKKARKKPGKRT